MRFNTNRKGDTDMKTNPILAKIFAVSFLLPTTLALADHQGGDPTDRLATEAQELNSIVSWSSLRYNVKMSVSSFTGAAQQLASCRDGNPNNEPNSEKVESSEPSSHSIEDHGGGGNNCSYQLLRTLSSFSPVDRYLSDTYYDYPQVYQQYLQVRDAVNAVRNGGL